MTATLLKNLPEKEFLLTYLFGHYNLLQILASANLRRHISRAVAAVAVLVCDNHHLAQIRRPYEILRRIFLSKTPNACSSENVNVQVSAPYNKTGNMRANLRSPREGFFTQLKSTLEIYIRNLH